MRRENVFLYNYLLHLFFSKARSDVLGKICSELRRRHGRVVTNELSEGESAFLIHARLPVVESLGLVHDLQDRTSGLASLPQLRPGGWELFEADPLLRDVNGCVAIGEDHLQVHQLHSLQFPGLSSGQTTASRQSRSTLINLRQHSSTTHADQAAKTSVQPQQSTIKQSKASGITPASAGKGLSVIHPASKPVKATNQCHVPPTCPKGQQMTGRHLNAVKKSSIKFSPETVVSRKKADFPVGLHASVTGVEDDNDPEETALQLDELSAQLSRVRDYICSVRRARGLPVIEQIVHHAEKQRTLKKNK
ncbi:unnamed protein product [Protopolystoma xenopodis]|uniref:Elongation factor EFG domain-containing protein n=1 Tax=Protopolystoma xenopodis TaxID=117903 RepID=A0A3S5CFS2_9PLAT|nr:unnamed protein product [Protopolystoma xenopodis]